jgi:hypothetical protein
MARTLFRPGQPVEPRFLAHFHDTVMEALRQLRLALGTGVIFYGLDVRQEETGLLQVSPGLAWNGAGQPVALESALAVPPPSEAGPLWLCLRHHLLVEEEDVAGRPLRERDSVELVWLPNVPRDDETIALARLQRGPAGWLIDGSIARRTPPLAHRHTGETMPDRSGRLRFDGLPVRLAAPAGDEPRQSLQRLESAVTVEFTKLQSLLDELQNRLGLQGLEIEELRTEVAETAERAGSQRDGGGWQEAIANVREEFSLMAGAELREELDVLRAEVAALARRPASVGGDLGAFTPISALYGVGEAFAQKLRDGGIQTVSDLLAAAASPEARERVEGTGLGRTRLKRWGREADLLRLHGAGPSEVALLDIAGVTSSAALALEEPRALYDRLRAAAAERGDVAAPPLAWVQSWIEQAQHLPPVVEW